MGLRGLFLAMAAPGAAQAATPRRLALGHQQQRIGAAEASTAHEFGVGGSKLGQDLDTKARQQGLYGLPEGFGRPLQRGG